MERDVMPAICGRRNSEEERRLRGAHLLNIDITGDGVTTSHFLNVGFKLPRIFAHNLRIDDVALCRDFCMRGRGERH